MKENIDYRIDHEKKEIYVSHQLRNAAYTEGTEEYNVFAAWVEKRYCIYHDCSLALIQQKQN